MNAKKCGAWNPCVFFTHNRQVACLLWILTATALSAQQEANPADPSALKKLSLEELTQIEVTTPSKVPVKAFQSPMAIYVIPGEQIRRSGATSIPEALRLAPAVEVARIDGNKWSIGIRGFGTRFSRGVLVLIDGRTVYSTLLSGTYWEVQDTVMDDIDRIEIIRGPGGTIWGPNSVNGVINVITKEARNTQGVLASAGGGNEEQGFAGFRYGGSKGGNLNYRFYGKAFTRGPEFHPDGENFDDWRASQAGFRLDWRNGVRDSLTVEGDLYKEIAGERIQANTYEPPYQQIVNGNADLAGGNLNARWNRHVKDGDDIQIQAYFDRTTRHEPNFGEIRNTFDVDFLQSLRVGPLQRISWGLGARLSRADDLQVVSGLTFLPNQRTDQLFTGFLQDEIGLMEDHLTLTIGTKALRTNFTGFALEPSVRLAWTLDDNHAIWAAFTHSLRTPSDAEENFYLSGYQGRMVNGLPYFARFNANTMFAPEQLNGYELGYRQLVTKDVHVGVATFYNHYHDLFDYEITGPPFVEITPPPTHVLLPAQFGNGILGTTKGFEITPEWKIGSFWQIRASYSYLQMDLQNAPNSRNVESLSAIAGASPHHQATLQSSFDLSRSVSLDLTYRYVSSLFGQTPLVPAYSTGDVRLAWRFIRGCELSVAGRNLLQPSHPEYAGDPGPLVGVRRSAYLQLTWMK